MYIKILQDSLRSSLQSPKLRTHNSISSAVAGFYTSHGIQTNAHITQRKEIKNSKILRNHKRCTAPLNVEPKQM